MIKIHRPSLKRKARRFIANSARSSCSESPSNAPRHLLQLLAIGFLISNRTVRPFLLHAVFVKGAKSKFGSCIQWCLELFKSRMLIFSVAKGAMNPPRCYHVPGTYCKVKKTPKFVAKRKKRKKVDYSFYKLLGK